MVPEPARPRGDSEWSQRRVGAFKSPRGECEFPLFVCRRLRDHGRQNKDIHVEIGFNLRFNDIQAAVGRVLLRRLDTMNDHRRKLAAR